MRCAYQDLEVTTQFAMSKTRGFVFTINNPVQHDKDELAALDCQYLIYGKEVGDLGTPHLQGYVHFHHPVTVRTVSRKITRAFIEIRKGTIDQAIDYCKKDGCFVETGLRPISNKEKGEKEKQRWRTIVEKAEIGDREWLLVNEPQLYFREMAKFNALITLPRQQLEGPLEHEWWYGKTGTGKSWHLNQLYPNHFRKKKNKWWDGYKGEAIIGIEEWSPENKMTTDQLKEWADRYPFKAETKGSELGNIRPMKIIVLSNFTIEECFGHQDAEALNRKFTVMTFPADIQFTIRRALPTVPDLDLLDLPDILEPDLDIQTVLSQLLAED